MFIRRAWPAVRLRSGAASAGEHTSGGLLRRSRLPRRWREMPLVLLARAVAGRLGLGAAPVADPNDDTRLAVEAAVLVRALTRRALSFLAECMALRSLRASMLHSESEPVSDMLARGVFSSTTMGRGRRGLSLVRCAGRDEAGGGDMLPALSASSVRSGDALSGCGEPDDRLRLSVGGDGSGDPE